MLKIFQSKERKAINKILASGQKEILNGKIMIKFYQWQIDNAPEDASKEELGKLGVKIKQMEDIITNNQRVDEGFKAFLRDN